MGAVLQGEADGAELSLVDSGPLLCAGFVLANEKLLASLGCWTSFTVEEPEVGKAHVGPLALTETVS